ncbi:ATP-dependent DNA helicase PcrA [Beutenbergia cavernae DSM 12333]|uniref:ATP-dependent DNA helicase n=1 Tax=Beutenbergia cavernae (strain ATCC BAA-8 / DSM 12333 / CCUG 43141 / JCM 11478 / NBRC 16432 / NCIMB 13614 / HKI 0122) TaxID=471853 RepID=C5BZU0_BEUC1|nr:DNA helicase PcrA [Beutenbergia cavernae]ACQ81270.1 ATP-dependent DNA helicase PcrA [Beutenbergia cavernae DSM 12333]
MTSLFDNLPLTGALAADTATAHSAVTADGARLPGLVPPREDAQPEPVRGGRGRDAEALLEGLNPHQRAAVVHSGPPLLIIAGAGSGKTRVLTHRIAYLLATRRARPGEILAITFTNKAAAEMRERVEALVGPPARAMWVSTFHSACVRILRREHAVLGLRSSFSIYDAADSLRLMTLVCRELGLDPKRYPPKAFIHRVSDLKNELVDPDAFAAGVGGSNPYEENLAEAYRMYAQRLRQANALDFDDLIMTTVNLLQAFPAVAEHYRRRFRHVLVDEYQDTNHAQYVLVRELAGVATQAYDDGGDSDLDRGPAPVLPAELTVVGDADQSIYAFRGATIRNILEFEADYPDATTILLEQNYRSTQNILSAANAVIARNPDRKAKNLWTAAGAGPKIIGYVADSDHEEARFVAEEIDRLGDASGVRPGDVAVFYRTNAQSRALEEVLIRAGIPYKVVGGTRFYERREVKDAIAYLRAIANPDDAVNVRRILNVPKRGLGERSEAVIAAYAERERISFGAALEAAADVPGLATRALGIVTEFARLLADLRAMAAGGATPAEVLDSALDRSGYLAELRASDDPQDATRVENLAELHAVAAEFSEADPDGDLGDFLERVALVADTDQLPDDDASGGVVTLMTVHTAKGLEFPVVFVTGLEDGTFPHARSLADPAELSEERRLAYVALTRARERLYISRAAVRTAFGVPHELPASRFLDDIPDELLDWRRAESSMQQLRGSWGSGGVGSGRVRSGATGGTGPRTAPSQATGATFGSATPRADVPSLDVGDRVTHDAYGLGTVVALEGAGSSQVAKIDFGTDGVKRLLLRYSPVTKL